MSTDKDDKVGYGDILEALFIILPDLTDEELDLISSRANFILEDRIRMELEKSYGREIL